MSTIYGGAEYGAAYGPPRRVNFGWIGESWRYVSSAAGIWIGGILIYGLISAAVNHFIQGAFPSSSPTASFPPFGSGSSSQAFRDYLQRNQMSPAGQAIDLVFSWLSSSFISASLTRLALKQVRGEPVSFGDAFSGGPVFLNMLLLQLVTGLAIVVGCFGLCVGMFFVLAFLLPSQALVADGESVPNALSRSLESMKSDWLTAAGFVFVLMLLLAVSMLPCYLGLLVTVPMLHVIYVLAYRDMVGMPGAQSPALATPYGSPANSPQAGVWPPAPTQAPPAWPPPPGQPPYEQPAPPPYGEPPAQPGQPPYSQSSPPQPPPAEPETGRSGGLLGPEPPPEDERPLL